MSVRHIKQWQRYLGVKQDGDFGPLTLAASLKIYELAQRVETEPEAKPKPTPYAVENHRLYRLDGTPLNYRMSPNHGGEITPEIVVIHYTGDNSFQGALSWLCAAESKVSAHLLISKSGEVWQLLPFNLKAWHAGQSNYDGRDNVNGFSIGIENVGMGDMWPEDQIQANLDVIAALYATYKITDTVGHSDVAPGRKVDPGDLFPWERFDRDEWTLNYNLDKAYQDEERKT